MPSVGQFSFTSGEWSPSLYGRVDLARYYTALKACRNFIVRPFGGVENRPGTRFLGEIDAKVVYYVSGTEVVATAAEVLEMVVEFIPNPDNYTLADAHKALRQEILAATPEKDVARFIPFEVSSTDTFGLVFGHEYIMIVADGGFVLDVGTGRPLEIETNYQGDDLWRLKYTQNADVMTLTHPDYPTQQLSRYSNTDWRLSAFNNVNGPFQELNVDTSITMHVNNVTGAITITASAPAFTSDMVGRMIRLEQAPDYVGKKWEVAKTIGVNDIRTAGSGYYQALTAGTTGTVRPSVLEGKEADGDPGVTWLYLHSGFGIVRITGYTSTTVVTGTVLSRLPDSLVSSSTAKSVTGATHGSAADPDTGTPAVDARITCPAHGYVSGDTVTLAGGNLAAMGLSGAHAIIVIDVNTFDPTGVYGTGTYTSGGTATKTLTAVNSYKWALEAWGGAEGYPAATHYSQQRQVFGGTLTKKDQIWQSRSAGYLDFGTSVPLLDDDALNIRLAARKVNEIRHFVSLKDLVVLTSEGAWILQKEQGNPIPQANYQGKGGASHVPPVVVGQSALFVQEKGGAIRSLEYFFQSDNYQGKDVTITASHLLKGRTVVDWAFQEVPFSCVWIVLDDGGLLGLTYQPDQEVIGWHRHDTDGKVESVCCIPEGLEDAVYLIVKRTVEGIDRRYVERMASRQFTDVVDAFFVDSGLTYDGRDFGEGVAWDVQGGTEWTYDETLTFTSGVNKFVVGDVGSSICVEDASGEALRFEITAYASPTVVSVSPSRTVPADLRVTTHHGFGMARKTFTGLDHIEGKTISVLSDGNVQETEGGYVVTDGGFTLYEAGLVVHAGLPITADIETLDINVQGQSLQSKLKNVRVVDLIVQNTRGLQAGPDADHLLEVSPVPSGSYMTPVDLENGVAHAPIQSDWSEGGRVFIRQDQPLPATILAAIPDVSISGS